MSIAPANNASIAEGPALKVFQSIVTFGPMRFSNHPLALPTIACAWVMLGNAPTWMTVCAEAAVPANSIKIAAMRLRLVMALSPTGMQRQRQNGGLCLFLFTAAAAGAGGRFVHQVGERCVVKDLGGRIADIEKHLIERPVIGITGDEAA